MSEMTALPTEPQPLPAPLASLLMVVDIFIRFDNTVVVLQFNKVALRLFFYDEITHHSH